MKKGKYQLVLICFAFLLTTIYHKNAHAKIQTAYAEFKYVMGDNDTKSDAKKIAFIEAKRLCLEKIGTYVESETIVSNYQLTKDEVRLYSAGIVKVEIISEEIKIIGESMAVYVKVKANYDKDTFLANLKEIISDKKKTAELKKINELEQKVLSLQKKLATSPEDKNITKMQEDRKALLSDYDKIVGNINKLTKVAKKGISEGMTIQEVEKMMGTARSEDGCLGKMFLNYGLIWVYFESGIVKGYIENEYWEGACFPYSVGDRIRHF